MNDQLRNIDLSKLHIYSYGIVVEDNKDNESIIKVFPIEKMYTEGGELKETPLEGEVSSKFDKGDKQPDLQVKKEKLNIVKSNFLYAEWMQYENGNRITPPNVYKGEKVVIYRLSNKNEFKWVTMETDLKLRRDEHVIYEYRTNKKEREELDDSYFIKISPKNKIVHIHLSNSNGELTTYDISVDTDKGVFKLIDGKDNMIELNSKDDVLNTNINKMINVTTETINFKVKDYNIETERFNMKSSESTAIESGKTDIKSDEATTLESGSDTIIKASKVDMDAGSGLAIKGGTVTHDGIKIGKAHTHISAKPGDPTSPPV